MNFDLAGGSCKFEKGASDKKSRPGHRHGLRGTDQEVVSRFCFWLLGLARETASKLTSFLSN